MAQLGVEEGKQFAEWRCLSLCEKLGKPMPKIEWLKDSPDDGFEMQVFVPNEAPRRIELPRPWLEDPRWSNGTRIEEHIKAALRA